MNTIHKALLVIVFIIPAIGASQKPTLTPEDIQALNQRLIAAIKTDNYIWAKRLIEAGAHANHVITAQGYTPVPLLVEAISHTKNPNMIRLLLEHGADPRLIATQGINPIYSLINRFVNKGNLSQDQFIAMLAHLFAAGATIDQVSQRLIEERTLQPLIELAQQLRLGKIA